MRTLQAKNHVEVRVMTRNSSGFVEGCLRGLRACRKGGWALFVLGLLVTGCLSDEGPSAVVDAGDSSAAADDDAAANAASEVLLPPPPPSCPGVCPDDGNPCTDDVCDPLTGYCGVLLADGAACDPGACTEASCHSGICIPAATGCTAPSGNPCLYAFCDREDACQYLSRGKYLKSAATWEPLGAFAPLALTGGSDGLVYTTDVFGDAIVRLDLTTGDSQRLLSQTMDAWPVGAITLAADGFLYTDTYSGDMSEPVVILRVEPRSGEGVVFSPKQFNTLLGVERLIVGPDGSLYAIDSVADNIHRLDGQSGLDAGAFVSAGAGGLSDPSAMRFGPDGHLYVVDAGERVLRFDGGTGAFLDVFVSAGAGGLGSASDLRFRDGATGWRLLVADAHWQNKQVLSFDGLTGAFDGVLVNPGAGGLQSPSALALTPSGDVLVADWAPRAVHRYDGETGAHLETLTYALFDPFTPNVFHELHHAEGWLYVTNWRDHSVLRYDAASGTYVDVFVSPGDGGLVQGAGLAFGPDGDLYVCSLGTGEVLRYDGQSGAFVSSVATGIVDAYALAFGPDDALYVTDGTAGQAVIKRVDLASGDTSDFTVPRWELFSPRDLVFHTDGLLYVASAGTSRVVRFDAASGAFVDALPLIFEGEPVNPRQFTIGPDGLFYVAESFSDCRNYVLRFHPDDGQFIDHFEIDPFVAATDKQPRGMAFGDDGLFYLVDGRHNDVRIYAPPMGPCDGTDCTELSVCGVHGVCVATGLPEPDGVACDDGDPCTLLDACLDGLCDGGEEPCDDGDPCTEDACDASGGCVSTAVPDGLSCDDGDPCTLADACVSGACAGALLDCDDDDPCTDDACDASAGCSNTPVADGTPCVPDLCSALGACGLGVCVPPLAPAPDPCHELAQVPAHQFAPETGKVSATQTITLFDVEAPGGGAALGSIGVSINQPADPASGIWKGSGPLHGPTLVATGDPSLDLWLDLDLASATLDSGDPFPCTVAVSLLLVWDAGSPLGVLDSDHALEIAFLDGGGDVLTGPDGQALAETFTAHPPGPAPNAVLVFAPPALYALADQPDCGGAHTLRVRFPPSSSTSPRNLPFYHVMLNYL